MPLKDKVKRKEYNKQWMNVHPDYSRSHSRNWRKINREAYNHF